MKLTNININKFLKNNKYKLMVLTPILCGVVLLSGCVGLKNEKQEHYYYDPNDIYNSQTDENTKTYDVTIISNNGENLEEKDLIMFYDENGEGFNVVRTRDTEYETTTPVNKYVIRTKYLGDVEAKVELEENERAVIYIDYLTKTITVENELVLTK